MPTIIVNELGDTTSANGTLTLREAIDSASAGDTITFDPSLAAQTITLSSAITLDKNLTIEGDFDGSGDGVPDISITTGNFTTLFVVNNAAEITINSLELKDVSSSAGSGLDIAAGAKVTINDSAFDNMDAFFSGGAIRNAGELTLNSTTIANSDVLNGPGGAIFNTGTLTLNDSTIDTNTSGDEGGGIYSSGTLTLNDSTISNCTASLDGGGIHSSGPLTLDGSTVQNCSTTGGNGGGIYNGGTLTLQNGTLIQGNSAELQGGGIYATGNITADLTSIDGNSAANAGALFAELGVVLTFSNGTVSNNSATQTPSVPNGLSGAIQVAGNYASIQNVFENMTFSCNTAISTNLMASVFVGYDTTFINSTFVGNSATYGAVIDDVATSRVINSTFTGNSSVTPRPIVRASSIENSIIINSDPNLNGVESFVVINSLVDIDPALVFATLDANGDGVLADNGGPVQTVALLNDPSNPALDASLGANTPTTDATGNAPYDVPGVDNNGADPLVRDLGAFELQCYAAGTLIRTPSGDRAVETLEIGALITTADGREVPVLWLAHQALRRGQYGPRMQPVRIRAGALGDGLPHSDLVVTADHGMIVDGMVINASALVNGDTIDFVPMAELEDRFTVYHIETEAHDVILANGAPSETFIDAAGRAAFDNHAEYLDLYGVERILPEMAMPRIASARLVPQEIKDRLAGNHAEPVSSSRRVAC